MLGKGFNTLPVHYSLVNVSGDVQYLNEAILNDVTLITYDTELVERAQTIKPILQALQERIKDILN